MCANFSGRFCNGTQISLFACETAFPLFFLDFHHISSSGEPSLMFCCSQLCSGNDKTDHLYPAHLPPELKTQNNLIQNLLYLHHYLYLFWS